MDRDAAAVLSEQLLPQAYLLTPNIPEAERLLGTPIRTVAEAEDAARSLHARGAAYVLVKGGHLQGNTAVDVLFDGQECHRLSSGRIFTGNTHGTGCSFASAIASFLARGEPLRIAVEKAKQFITAAIRLSRPLGKGHSPVNHYLSALEFIKEQDQ